MDRDPPRGALAAATRGVGLLLALTATPLGGSLAAMQPAPAATPPAYAETIDVSLVTLVARVVDSWGNPILGLGPEDFRVRLGDREARVVAVDWIAPGERATEAVADEGRDGQTRPPDGSAAAPSASGTTAGAVGGERLFVVFVQADLRSSRISGQLRLRPHTRDLLATLHAGDRVAVVSFDSHLKPRLDFTADLAAVHAAVDRGMLFARQEELTPSRPHSLLAHLDPAAARAAASPERALELVGRALAALPGEKTMVYLGWGLGRFSREGVRMTPAFEPAVRALRAARTAVFVLDVTSADYHSLEVGLESVAQATGGMYFSTFRLPALATRTLGRALAGHYVLTLEPGALRAGEAPRLRIRLRSRQGTVLARPLALR